MKNGSAEVGMRDLTHHTAEVMARVREGETLNITHRGRVIARLVPAEEPSLYEKLAASGVITPPQVPGFLPSLRASATVDAAATDEILAERYGEDAR
jgi:prevent-host-death family protein